VSSLDYPLVVGIFLVNVCVQSAFVFTLLSCSNAGWERRSNSPANMLSPDQMVQRIRYTSRRFLAASKWPTLPPEIPA
jgi:hypothetical protein